MVLHKSDAFNELYTLGLDLGGGLFAGPRSTCIGRVPSRNVVKKVDKEQLVSKIQQHLKAGEFEQAVEKLEVLYRLDKQTVALFNIAIAREKQRASCMVRASAYERVLKACHGCDEELNARKRLAEIRGDCFGTLVITTQPEGLEVTVNGRSVGRAPIEAEFAEGATSSALAVVGTQQRPKSMWYENPSFARS